MFSFYFFLLIILSFLFFLYLIFNYFILYNKFLDLIIDNSLNKLDPIYLLNNLLLFILFFKLNILIYIFFKLKYFNLTFLDFTLLLVLVLLLLLFYFLIFQIKKYLYLNYNYTKQFLIIYKIEKNQRIIIDIKDPVDFHKNKEKYIIEPNINNTDFHKNVLRLYNISFELSKFLLILKPFIKIDNAISIILLLLFLGFLILI